MMSSNLYFLFARKFHIRELFVILCSTLFILGCGNSSGGGTGTSTIPASTAPNGGGSPNALPSITSQAPLSASTGKKYTYQIVATDADGDPLNYTLITAPYGMTLSNKGLVEWTPTSGQQGSFSVKVMASDPIEGVYQSWIITVASAPSLPTSLTISTVATLPNGMQVISDMQAFQGKLFITAAINPLSSPFGAGIYTYDTTYGIRTVKYDYGSQGYLRAKVYDGKLFIPDGDPNGQTNGTVYIWTATSSTPITTVVPNGVHNFDVIKFNNNIYVSGAINGNIQTLHRYNSSNNTWTLASQSQPSPYSLNRLKYLGIQSGKIWASGSPGQSSQGFQISSNMAQSGYNVNQNGGILVCLENIDSRLYMTSWGNNGVVQTFFVNSNGATVALTGDAAGKVVWDYIKHSDGNYYSVGTDLQKSYVFGSSDGINWKILYSVADSRFGKTTSNADGRASIASYGGKLYVGSSTNGRIYRMK